MRFYWSNTDFADMIRGTTKPPYASMEEWDEWESTAKNNHPFRYWLAEEFFDDIEDIIVYIPNKLNYIRCYIKNRFVDHTHRLTASKKHIKPGEWCDVGYRFLPCLFNELQDYVEVEVASSHVMWMTDDDEKIKKYPPFKYKTWFNWSDWRCPQAGIDYLNWASSLTHEDKPTKQAIDAAEILELYYWWVNDYPNRPDPDEASGIDGFYDTREAEGKKWSSPLSPDEKTTWNKFNDIREDMIKQQTQEDTEMLIRLIKVRDALWT